MGNQMLHTRSKPGMIYVKIAPVLLIQTAHHGRYVVPMLQIGHHRETDSVHLSYPDAPGPSIVLSRNTVSCLDLLGDDVHGLNLRWRNEEFLGALEEGVSKFTLSMCSSPFLVLECVKDAECRWSTLERVPVGCAGFSLNEWCCSVQKSRYFGLFARSRVQHHKDSQFVHTDLLDVVRIPRFVLTNEREDERHRFSRETLLRALAQTAARNEES